MKVKSISTSIKELDFQLKETTQNEFQPTLAIIFSSPKCDLSKLNKIVDSHGIDIFGASSSGEIIDTGISSESISIMLLDIDREFYQIQHKAADFSNSIDVGRSVVEDTNFSNPAYLVVLSLSASGECLIKGITDASAELPTIFGGMAGDDLAMTRTFTFTNNRIDDNGVTVLVLDNDKIEVDGLALCGWQPIGIENTITKSKNNVIYEINNKPALTVVKSYFGEFIANQVGPDNIPFGFAQYPLQVVRNDSYVLRVAMHSNEEDGSIIMASPVHQGDKFYFSIAPSFDIIDETIEGFHKFAAEQAETDAVLMFSCIARHMFFGPMIEDEIEGVYNIWKKPMTGFFTYGEIGQHKNQISQLYNETCSLVLLREK